MLVCALVLVSWGLGFSLFFAVFSCVKGWMLGLFGACCVQSETSPKWLLVCVKPCYQGYYNVIAGGARSYGKARANEALCHMDR